MSLVAKEGPTVNNRDRVLLLSESVGAWEQLRRYALSVSPADVEGICRALHEALCMSPEEKRRRVEGLRHVVQAADITHWLSRQFEDLMALT